MGCRIASTLDTDGISEEQEKVFFICWKIG